MEDQVLAPSPKRQKHDPDLSSTMDSSAGSQLDSSDPDTDMEQFCIMQKKVIIYRAVAGHGKTRWLAKVVDYLVKRCGMPPEEIIGFSYTREASKTLRERIENCCGVRVQVQTMHSWCNAFLSKSVDKYSEGSACLSIMVKEVLALAQNPEMQDAIAAHNPSMFIFVDEAQDCNPEQYRLITLLQELWDSTIILVGDSAQSIYSFQGADYKLFLDFVKNSGIDPDVCFEVQKSENFRSSQRIIDAANANASHITGTVPMVQGVIEGSTGHKGGLPVLRCFQSQEDEVQFVCHRIQQMITEEGVSPERIAVLSRNGTDLVPLCFEMIANYDLDIELNAKDTFITELQIFVDGEDGAPQPVEPETDGEKKVRLKTIHNSKGGQWDHVFLISAHDWIADNDDTEEERRVFHVAMTRAMQSLTVTYARQYKGIGKSLIRFITRDDTHLYDVDGAKNPTPAKLAQIQFWDESSTQPFNRVASLPRSMAGFAVHSIETMSLGDLKSLMQLTAHIPMKTFPPIEFGPMGIPPIPNCIVNHNMGQFYRTFCTQLARLVAHRKNRTPAPFAFMDSHIARLVLLPAANHQTMQAIQKTAEQHPQVKGQIITRWPPQCLQQQDPTVYHGMHQVQKRQYDIIRQLFKNDRSLYVEFMTTYGLLDCPARPWDHTWDQFKDKKRQRRTNQLKVAFVNAHMGRVDGEPIPGPSILEANLFNDFTAFSRTISRQGSSLLSGTRIDPIVDHIELIVEQTMVRDLGLMSIDHDSGMALEIDGMHSDHPLKTYTAVFDFVQRPDKQKVITYQLIHQLGPMRIQFHDILCTMLSATHLLESDQTHKIINIATGSVIAIEVTKGEVDRLAQSFVSKFK